MSNTEQKQMLIAVSPLTELDSVVEAEAANLRSSQKALGERRKLASDVLVLYDLVARNTALTMAASEEEQHALLVMLVLLSGCRFQFTMSVLQNWRGRSTEALVPLRRASEQCATACYIRAHPALADVWLAASGSHEAYRQHKKAFQLKLIFPDSDAILKRLFGVFDFASKVIHCSVFSVAGHVQGLPSFRYFDIESPRDPALIRTFIVILSAHELMLAAFVRAFSGVLEDESSVERELRVFSERLQRHRDATMEHAMSDISKEVFERVSKRNT
jgi:hypothetical protein